MDLARRQEREVRQARQRMEQAIGKRNATVKALRAAGASYGDIAETLGLTRAGVVGICRKAGAE